MNVLMLSWTFQNTSCGCDVAGRFVIAMPMRRTHFNVCLIVPCSASIFCFVSLKCWNSALQCWQQLAVVGDEGIAGRGISLFNVPKLTTLFLWGSSLQVWEVQLWCMLETSAPVIYKQVHADCGTWRSFHSSGKGWWVEGWGGGWGEGGVVYVSI